MANVRVQLPAALHARVKARLGMADLSDVVRRALEVLLSELDRRDALERAVADYEAEHAAFTEAERRSIEARATRVARRPRLRGPKRRAAFGVREV